MAAAVFTVGNPGFLGYRSVGGQRHFRLSLNIISRLPVDIQAPDKFPVFTYPFVLIWWCGLVWIHRLDGVHQGEANTVRLRNCRANQINFPVT